MKILCSNEACSNRRIHYERPDENRPHQTIEVPDDWKGPYYFCSFTCALEARKYHLRYGWIHDQPGKTSDDKWEYEVPD